MTAITRHSNTHQYPLLFVASIALVAFLGIAGPTGAACEDPPTGITAWWGGDGNAGDVYGSWNGELVGTTGFTEGHIGGAFSFDGSGARVDVDAAGAGELGSAPFTIDLWFNTDIVGNGTYIIGKSHPDGGQGWDIRLRDRRIELVGFNGWPAQYNLQTFQIVTLGQWHHLAVTSDGFTVTLYFDGATDPTWTIPRQPISSTANPLRLGMTTNFGGLPFDGEIDEIRFFDRPLDAAEIAAIFASGSNGNCRPCTALPSSALGWWRAEDNGDDAVLNNIGLPDNGTTFDDGVVGRAFSFDGSDDVVRLPDNDLWDLGTDDFSIAAWFKSGTPGYRNIIRYHNGSNAGSWGLRLETSGRVQLLLIDQSGSSTVTLTSDAVLSDNEWHHVVGTRDAAAGELRLFVDGTPAATPVSDSGLNVVGAPDARAGIGAGQWGGSVGTWEIFNGLIDEVGIFLHPLTQTEVEMLYNAGASGICAECIDPVTDQVGWWRGEGSGFDSAGGHHGTSMNNAGFAPGLVGSAIELPDGGDFIEVPHSPELAFGATDPLSIELWAWRATDRDAQHLFSKRFDCFSSPWNYQMYWQLSTNKLCFGNGSDPNTNYVCSTADMLPLQKWTHLAVSFDGTNATLFVNARSMANTAMILGPDTNSPPLRFGSVANCDWADQGFTGLLDEIQIFDRRLSRSEIAASFAAGRHGACRECAPLPDGLASWWRGDGDASDDTGDNDGDEMNGAGYGSGLVGRAFSFDDDSLPGYIEVPHSTSLDITGSFSAEGWVHMDQPADALLFDKGDATGSAALTSYALDVDAGSVRSVLYGDYSVDVRTSSETIEAGAWHHVAVTWDGSTVMPDNVNLYLDGRPTDTWTKTTTLNSTTESLTIGAMKPPNYAQQTDGRIDELSIYDRVLTGEEITAIFRAGSAGKCDAPNLIPDPFSFDDQINVATSSDIESNTITVSGIDAPTSIGIASCTSNLCDYTINGGGWTSASGTVADGDMVKVRQRSSAFYGWTTDLTLDIGTVTDTFSVTTLPGHTLTVILAGDGAGSVVSDPVGIDCPNGACFWVFAADGTVDLTPTADPGSAFAGWSGPADCADGLVTMTTDINCTATFDFLGIFADGFESGDTIRWSLTTP